MTLAIYADSKHEGRCRTCGAAITWAELITGARHPFNGTITGARLRPALFPGGRDVEDVDTVSHFATCPQAAQHRRRRG